MKEKLALTLLARITGWSDDELADWLPKLLRLSEYKYDDYEGFGAGERFLESLGRWLSQFDDPATQRVLCEFILTRLVFISRDEINHAIACAYPDIIKPALLDRTAETIGIDPFEVDRIAASDRFGELRRKTLYLGLSDGARLDRLRRSNPELSHEQFWLSHELGAKTRATMVRKLASALGIEEADARFEQVVLVDDFYGSGTSLLDWDVEERAWKGKLTRAGDHLRDLAASEPVLLIDQPDVTVVIYVASARAIDHIGSCLQAYAPTWNLEVVQVLANDLVVADGNLVDICKHFYDPVLVDEHKGAAPLGYKDTALPVVLHHNTPNNSVSILWADSTDRAGGAMRHALFPRYERHHADRP